MITKSVLRVIILAGLICGGIRAWCQETEKRGITLDINPHYISAYRDGSWVPVDVLVTNDDRDIKGWVEVRTAALGGDLQSPIYRVPADCPRGSRKWFRFHCRLERTGEIEARLYHGNRLAIPFPTRVTVRPIDPNDLLGLVMDKEPEDLGFLYLVADAMKGKQRFHRERFETEQLGYLPDFPQVYTSYDVIIMGNIDPGQIAAAHRDALLKYVQRGGMLVVCTGEYAANYRGSWVEPLLGVELGAQETTSEVALAQTAFPQPDTTDAEASRECVLTRLTPKTGAVKVWGGATTLATLNPVGQGFVATIAIDASSRVLQKCPAYLDLWRELSTMRRRELPLNYAAASGYCVEQLPYLTGVRIQPKSSVIMYLGLYFGVAILGNWVVCSLLKRRELAWLLLIVFSIGFTAYAMIYGTMGRAKASEMERIQVVRVPPGGGIANVHSVVGVLTARSARYAGQLMDAYALAGDVSSEEVAALSYRRGRDYGGGVRPFYLIQEQPGRISDLRIGASEMRLMHVESFLETPGGIEGQLVLDDAGLHGTLTNKTGMEFAGAVVVMDGCIYPARKTDEGFTVDVAPGAVGAVSFEDAGVRFYGYYEERTAGDLNSFKAAFQRCLFRGEFLGPRQQVTLDANYGPYLCAWTKAQGPEVLVLDTPMPTKIAETLVVADVAVDRRKDLGPLYYPLDVYTAGQRYRGPYGAQPGLPPASGSAPEWQGTVAAAAPEEVNVMGLPGVYQRDAVALLVDLYHNAPEADAVELVPLGRAWPTAPRVETVREVGGGVGFFHNTYRIEDWQSCLNPRSGLLELGVVYKPLEETARPGAATPPSRVNFAVFARLELPRESREKGGVSSWR